MIDPTGEIDRSSSVPFHYQLRKLLEQQIETGRWPQGDRLPSEPFLSEYFGVSRATVRQALHALEEQGLIHKEKGRGAFVNRDRVGATSSSKVASGKKLRPISPEKVSRISSARRR